ncbi:acyl carrier protein [Actinomadura oligospora]|uniref:acyl carrier protein n=1 Tax=Actinomadura oligospora TaxID=111804 RepID=UPI00047DD470|nr:phosphopantetheine-binding protein [Actinomadura oligospora]
MNAQEALDTIQTILADRLGVERSLITPDASLREDLALDSIDAYDLLTDVEERYALDIDPGRFSMVGTVADVIAVMQDTSPERAMP